MINLKIYTNKVVEMADTYDWIITKLLENEDRQSEYDKWQGFRVKIMEWKRR